MLTGKTRRILKDYIIKIGGAMAQFKPIRITYSIKNEDGFMVERQVKFTSLCEAYLYVKSLKQNSNLIGKPILETK